jgi:ubiquinone/menaquinone biosynthesis C-methylase UbiE
MEQAMNPLAADEYARLTGFDGKWRETWWRKDFLSFVSKQRGFDQARRILDVGCGAGHWGRTLSQVISPGALIAGVDIESKFIERSQELGRAFGLSNTDYRVGSAEEIPCSDSSFDLVTCQTVLIHVRDPLRVLREMKRVLKPGGVLLLAEPNNLTWYFSSLLAEPRPEWSVVLRLVDFYHTCLLGKKELGMGDSSVGERLPELVSQLGLAEIQVAINENCPSLYPPYSVGTQPIELQFLKGVLESGAWMGFGPRHNSLRFFQAGGGLESEFDKLWAQAMSFQQGLASALENHTCAGGRGTLMYLVSGVKE